MASHGQDICRMASSLPLSLLTVSQCCFSCSTLAQSKQISMLAAFDELPGWRRKLHSNPWACPTFENRREAASHHFCESKVYWKWRDVLMCNINKSIAKQENKGSNRKIINKKQFTVTCQDLRLQLLPRIVLGLRRCSNIPTRRVRKFAGKNKDPASLPRSASFCSFCLISCTYSANMCKHLFHKHSLKICKTCFKLKKQTYKLPVLLFRNTGHLILPPLGGLPTFDHPLTTMWTAMKPPELNHSET